MKILNVCVQSLKQIGGKKSKCSMEYQSNKLTKSDLSLVARQSERLAKDFISYRLGHNPKPFSQTAVTLRRLADEIELQYPSLLNHLCHKLNISRNTAYSTFVEIASEVFADGVNWGRIVALFAFGGKLAVYCDQHNMKDLVDLVTDWVGKFISDLSEWIEKEGGWVSEKFLFNFFFIFPLFQNISALIFF